MEPKRIEIVIEAEKLSAIFDGDKDGEKSAEIIIYNKEAMVELVGLITGFFKKEEK